MRDVVIKIDSQEFIENMFAAALKIDDYLAIVEAVQQTGFIADKDVFVNKKVLQKGSKKVSTFNTQ